MKFQENKESKKIFKSRKSKKTRELWELKMLRLESSTEKWSSNLNKEIFNKRQINKRVSSQVLVLILINLELKVEMTELKDFLRRKDKKKDKDLLL